MLSCFRWLIIAVTEDYIKLASCVTEWWHAEDIDSSGTERIQGPILALVWRNHEKAPKILDNFIGILIYLNI